jgi:hypothetical protein
MLVSPLIALAVPTGGSRREADGGFARFGRTRTEKMDS